MSLKTITIASAKGGTTKTSTTAALAVRASKESEVVAMFDLNSDQGNLTNWWTARGQMDLSPRLVDIEDTIPREARLLERQGCEWLFIDTPPLEMDLIEQSIQIADFVVIPVRTSAFDVLCVEPVVAMCKQHRVKYAFLLGAVDNSFKTLIAQTLAFLKKQGPVLESRTSYLAPYIQAVTVGKTAPELNKRCAGEIDALWAEVKALTISAAASADRARHANG